MTTTTAPATTTSTTTSTRALPSREQVQRLTLGAVRVVLGFLFVCHGLQGLLGLFGGIDTVGAAVPVFTEGWYASVIEAVGGGLIALGLATRPAALLCSGTMAFAYFTVHAPMGLFPVQNMGEQAVLFCWAFLLIAVFGPGSLALDNLRRSATMQR